ncbi:MAG: DUF2283 domain-containing protein [Chloroflexota bacterium]|nr:DUF2283 domain-containing protein [Chloroflexota bacterium]
MRIEFDATRDLLYVWMGKPGTRAARTETLSPGVHVDFDAKGKLLGLEVLDASKVLGQQTQFEVVFAPKTTQAVSS